MTQDSLPLSLLNSKLALISTIIICLLLSFGCNAFYNKDNYIKDFEAFIQEVKTNSPNYKETDWKNADLQYDKYTVEQYEKFKAEISEKDKETIGKLKGAYNVYKFKKETKDALEQTKDFIYQVKGALEEVTDSIK